MIASRRRIRRTAGVALALAALSAPLSMPPTAAMGAGEAQAELQISPRIDQATGRGLEYLARSQNADGSFGKDGPRVAVSALCVLSFLACGHIPGEGRYAQTVRRGVDFLIASAPEDGYFGRKDGSRMYGHGIITMTLAEAYGVERLPARREKLRGILEKAVKVILDAQNAPKSPEQAGGWRYEPASGDSDLSLSGWNVLALRACNNIGLASSKEASQRAVAYVLRCHRAEQKGFAYQPGNEPSPAMTGVGVLTLCLMDAQDRPEVAQAAEYLRLTRVDEGRFPYYSYYYTTQAAFQVGKAVWQAVWPANSQKLLSLQQDDGGWPQSRDGQEPGRSFATAMAVLSLSTPLKLIPVHQR